jgi:hypothetical protein
MIHQGPWKSETLTGIASPAPHRSQPYSLAGSQCTPISLHTRNTAFNTSEVVSAVDDVPVDTISS